MSERSLSELKVGHRAVITRFIGDDEHISRLQEMGVHKGVAVRVIKYAPFGDPLEVKIRGFHVSMRRAIADKIFVLIKDESTFAE